MADIWSNVGGDFVPQGEDWLYQKGSQVHGPVPKETLVNKLMTGELDAKTMVAKEGGEFYPISQIAAFAPHLEEVKKVIQRQTAKKIRRVAALIVLLVAAVGAGVGYYFKLEADKKAREQASLLAAEEERLRQQAEERRKIIAGEVELVALVSFDESKMKVGGGETKPSTRRTTPKGGRDKGAEDAGPPEMVSKCERSQGEIFGVLRSNLAKINFCVEDEKKRDQGNLLPPTLNLSFVARPDGKVSDFEILDRHYRTGPMRNCMLKAFRLISFPPAKGTNCPVQIPIKIGG